MTTLILGFLFSLSASAYDVCVDGIYYNLNTENMSAEVTIGVTMYTGEITIPNTITKFGEIYNVTSIGDDAFRDCYSLTSVTIPNSVTSIGSGVFHRCSSLTSVNIPDSVKYIEYETFRDCSSLMSVTIPNSLTYIGDYAFLNCYRLTAVNIPNSVTSIGIYAFRDCYSLTSVNIPNSVTSIGEYTFCNCSSLTSVTIPNSVTSIGVKAFLGCSSLTSVTIGNMVKKISKEAFANCKNLENVYCYAEEVPSPTSEDAFKNAYIENATLYVPASAVNPYKVNLPWKNFGAFKTIEEIESKKCESPTIAYKDGELHFSCATEDVEYVSNIKCADVNTFYTSQVALTACYDIEVYATKNGYENSDISTAKLYWLTSSGSLDANSINNIAMRGIAVQASDGFIHISGLNDNERVSLFTVDGGCIGNATAFSGAVTFTAQPNSIVVAKIGKESIKINVK